MQNLLDSGTSLEFFLENFLIWFFECFQPILLICDAFIYKFIHSRKTLLYFHSHLPLVLSELLNKEYVNSEWSIEKAAKELCFQQSLKNS